MSNGSERLPEHEQAKVDYVTREGHHSTAYIEEDSGEGTDKYSEIDVILEWSEERRAWIQIDTYEWDWSPYDGWYRTGEAAS